MDNELEIDIYHSELVRVLTIQLAVKTPASVSAPAIQGPSNPTASSVNSVTDEDMDQNNDDTTVLYHDDAPQSTG